MPPGPGQERAGSHRSRRGRPREGGPRGHGDRPGSVRLSRAAVPRPSARPPAWGAAGEQRRFHRARRRAAGRVGEGMPKRVYELAKELDLSSREVIAALAGLGFIAKSHSSTVENDVVTKLREAAEKGTLKQLASGGPAPRPAKAPAKRPTAERPPAERAPAERAP